MSVNRVQQQRDYMRERRKTRRAAGLCLDCPAPAKMRTRKAPGKPPRQWYCAGCEQKHKGYRVASKAAAEARAQR